MVRFRAHFRRKNAKARRHAEKPQPSTMGQVEPVVRYASRRPALMTMRDVRTVCFFAPSDAGEGRPFSYRRGLTPLAAVRVITGAMESSFLLGVKRPTAVPQASVRGRKLGRRWTLEAGQL